MDPWLGIFSNPDSPKSFRSGFRNPFKHGLYLIREACLAHETGVGHVPLLVSQLNLNNRFLLVDEI